MRNERRENPEDPGKTESVFQDRCDKKLFIQNGRFEEVILRHQRKGTGDL